MPNKKIKLLVVDDEKDICSFVKLLFKKEGFLVYSALSGSEAIAVVKKVKPDIVLLDIHMKKGMDGIQILREIEEINPQSRCLMVTWDSSQAKMKEAKHLGAVSYLTKPLTVSQLLKVVNRVVAARKRGK